MYLIKSFEVYQVTNKLIVENGVEITSLGHWFVNPFWGKATLSMEWIPENGNSDFIVIGDKTIIPTINSYTVTDGTTKDWKIFNFYKTNGEVKNNNIDGYLIFLNRVRNIKTNGKVLFERDDSLCVAELKDGEWISFSGYKVEIKEGKMTITEE